MPGLSIVHPDLNPQLITQALGLQPDIQPQSGKERLELRGKMLGKKAIRRRNLIENARV
jgi:hypothetical protein